MILTPYVSPGFIALLTLVLYTKNGSDAPHYQQYEDRAFFEFDYQSDRGDQYEYGYCIYRQPHHGTGNAAAQIQSHCCKQSGSKSALSCQCRLYESDDCRSYQAEGRRPDPAYRPVDDPAAAELVDDPHDNAYYYKGGQSDSEGRRE